MLSLNVPTGLSVLPHSVFKVVIITARGHCSYHGRSHESNYILWWSNVASWKLRMLNTIITLSKDCGAHQNYCLLQSTRQRVLLQCYIALAILVHRTHLVLSQDTVIPDMMAEAHSFHWEYIDAK